MVISSPIVILVNPALVAATGSNTVDTSSLHSSFSLTEKSTTAPIPSPTSISPLDSSFTTQAALSGVNARPSNNIVGVNSYYEVIFTTSTAGIIKFIDITFPAGTIIGSAPLLLVEKEGIGDGTATKVSNTQIRYTVTSAVNVPAGTTIRLEFFNIVNPPLTGSYAVTVTTRNAGGTAIDGPTGSTTNTIKQIATGQIADGAVTTPKIDDNAVTSQKIADGAITSTKPDESFMKKVILLDDADGNALGWDPDGMTTSFAIVASSLSGFNDGYVSVVIPSQCRATAIGEGVFNMLCSPAPAINAQLHYLVMNLPAHVNE